jgi:sec-independent protein translocase protein TatB
MMGISWMELMVIVMIGLIVIGPKDLPAAIRTVGQFVRGTRDLAREFQGHMDQLVRESELDALRRDVEDATRERAPFHPSSRAASESAAASSPSPAPALEPASVETDAPGKVAPKEADP